MAPTTVAARKVIDVMSQLATAGPHRRSSRARTTLPGRLAIARTVLGAVLVLIAMLGTIATPRPPDTATAVTSTIRDGTR